MTFSFGGRTYSLPDTLASVPLSQHMGYMAAYGNDLKQTELENALIIDFDKQNIANILLATDRLQKGLSYYSGLALSDARTVNLTDLKTWITATQLEILLFEVRQIDYTNPTYSGFTWVMSDPTEDDNNAVGFVNLNNTNQYLFNLLGGNWSNFPDIMDQYFRKVGEPWAINGRQSYFETFPMNVVYAFYWYLQQHKTNFYNGLMMVVNGS